MNKAVVALMVIFMFFTALAVVHAGWRGVDEAVVERYAVERGRGAREPYINTDKGDLLLFVFLLGGAVGGFVVGYYWRMLTERAHSIRRGKES